MGVGPTENQGVAVESKGGEVRESVTKRKEFCGYVR